MAENRVDKKPTLRKEGKHGALVRNFHLEDFIPINFGLKQPISETYVEPEYKEGGKLLRVPSIVRFIYDANSDLTDTGESPCAEFVGGIVADNIPFGGPIYYNMWPPEDGEPGHYFAVCCTGDNNAAIVSASSDDAETATILSIVQDYTNEFGNPCHDAD